MDYVTGNAEIADALNHHLAPSESVGAVLTVRPVATDASDESGPSRTANQEVCTLAVVTSSENTEEEGSIFIFRQDAKKDQSESDMVVDHQLLAMIPLTSALTISMAQSRSRSGTIDLRPGKYSPIVQPLFTLSLTYGRRKWLFSTESSEALGAFVAECRRLINVTNSASYLNFRWLNKYQSRRQVQVPTLSPRPDLRQLQKPAHMVLSSTAAGDTGDESADLLLILEDWFRRKLEEDRNVMTPSRNVRIRLGTFNVNGKTPSQDLSPWIRPQHTRTSDKPSLPPPKSISPVSLSSFTATDYFAARPLEQDDDDDLSYDPDGEPDIYVLGFQELDLSTEALLYSYSSIREDMWLEAVFAALGEVRHRYKKLISKQLVGMLIICIVKDELTEEITDIRTCAAGTGIMGMMGNKGAVALRMTLQSTVMTFVNAHLAAFDEYTDRRNAEFHDLSRRLLFVSADEPVEGTLEQPSESIFQSDVLFWMGALQDLNYRIDLPDADVRQLIGGGPMTRRYDIRDLLSQDQLTKSRLERKAFEDFSEGEICDLPSYRFSTGIATDSNGYDVKRRPAWTDRILFQLAPRIRYRQTSYAVHSELTMSDHKPVSAEFSIAVRRADESAYYRQVRRLIGQIEDLVDSDETPQLKVLSPEIKFGDFCYNRTATQNLTLRNTGKVPCAFRFVSASENEPVLPRWLSATPQMGVILPNEESTIQLATNVDGTSAQLLNLGKDHLEHALILHTIRGKDHFIVVAGNYKRTCLANELAILVRLAGPIRSLESLSEPPPDKSKTKLNAPREVMRLINWLMTHASDVPDLFLVPGESSLEESIHESLDTGEEFTFDLAVQSEGERRKLASSFADVLFKFFHSLPSSVIPATLQERCSRAADRDEAFEVLSTELPGYVLNVWISLTAFLHYLGQRNLAIQEKPNEASIATILACIFAPVLIRDDSERPPRMTPLAKRRFLLHFIQ